MTDLENQDESPRIGALSNDLGVSPRMLRYLEQQGVLRPERGPDPRGHRHYPPPELALGNAASAALRSGATIGALATIRRLAERRVAAALADGDPLLIFELLAVARSVELATRPVGPPGGPPRPPSHPPGRVEPHTRKPGHR